MPNSVSRRSFIRSMGLLIGAASVAPAVVSAHSHSPKPMPAIGRRSSGLSIGYRIRKKLGLLTDQEKRESLITQALNTTEGRQALAQAMVEPIRRKLEYQSIGRKLLMVEELPQGALARYEKDVRSTAHVLVRRCNVPQDKAA